MSRESSKTERMTMVVAVSLLLVAASAGLVLSQGLTEGTGVGGTDASVGVSSAAAQPLNLSITPTPTPDDGGSDGNEEPSQALVVDDNDADCPDADHSDIQSAVDNVEKGGTVIVCTGTYESVDIQRGGLTLRADGEAVIEGGDGPAIRSTGPQVAIRGFTVRAATANRTMEIGGRDTVVKKTTLELDDDGPAAGIYLADGRTDNGETDPNLDAATGSLVENSTFEVTSPIDSGASVFGVHADADGTVVRSNDFTIEGNTSAIYSTGNETEIRGNSIEHLDPPQRIPGPGPIAGSQYPQRPAIQVGAKLCQENRRDPNCTDIDIINISAPSAHDWARQNIVANNEIDGTPRNGIMVLKVSTGTVVQSNDVMNSPRNGIYTKANNTAIRDNNISTMRTNGIHVWGFDQEVSGNTIDGAIEYGLQINSRNTVVRDNVIRNNDVGGVFAGSEGNGRLVNNRITNNRNGIALWPTDDLQEDYEIEYNTILNNENLGIWVQEFNPTADKSPIINATNNFWDCGGPSSGLEDPYTGRVANGTGDAISAGNETGKSNVHFDPFFDIGGEACPSEGSTPTATPTDTPISTATRTATPAGGNDDGDGGGSGGDGDGSGTGSGSGSGAGGDSIYGSDADDDSDDSETSDTTSASYPLSTATQTPTETPTATPSPSPTVSPTPMVEPGFGAGSWLVGAAIVVGFMIIRRRRTRR